jgi:hypothetical protein
MAAMTYEMARAAAEKLIQSGRANGLTREALISQIIAGAPAAGEAPQGAIASALMPQPRVLTAATPAQMQPEPLVAPKPVAPAQPQAEAMPAQEAEPQPAAATPRPSQYRQMLESTLAEIAASEAALSQAAANKQPVDIIEQARLRALKSRAQQFQNFVQAEESAGIPEEMRAALEGKQERLNRREELLKESKARSPWEALLAGGAAMAQGRRGENFGEALSRGLQTGLQDYGRSRRENVEGVESVGEARDKVVMDRFNILQKARADAVALVNSGQDVDERTLRVANLTTENALKAALAPLSMRKGAAEAKSAEFDAANAPALFADRRSLTAAQIRNLDEPPGGGGGKVDVERRAYEAKLEDAVGDFKEADAEYKAALEYAGGDPKAIADPKVVSNRLAKQARALQASTAFFKRYKETPYPFGGAAMGRKAAAKPAAAKADPLGIRR